MAHFGVIPTDGGSHLNPMLSVARELTNRGHRVTFYCLESAKHQVEGAGFGCRVYGLADLPAARSRAVSEDGAKYGGVRGMYRAGNAAKVTLRPALEELPGQIRRDQPDLLLIDETQIAGRVVANIVDFPHVIFSMAIYYQGSRDIPPFCTSWSYRTDFLGKLRNRVGHKLFGLLALPIALAVRREGSRYLTPGKPEVRPVAHICQQPPEFDYPRVDLPPTTHFVGPLTDGSIRAPIPFPFEQLDGRPLIYASLGTILGRRSEVFQRIAEACDGLAAQLVITLGGAPITAALRDLPGSPIVVSRAPQLELLDRAALCITHAGLNTTLECLARGVPLVAIPIVNDGPGVAARIAWTGVGEFIKPRSLNPQRLRALIERVLKVPSYRLAAARMSEAVARAGGVKRAADIVEQCNQAKPADL